MIHPVTMMVFLGLSCCFLGVPSLIIGMAGGAMAEKFGNLDGHVRSGVAATGAVLTALGVVLLIWSRSWHYL